MIYFIQAGEEGPIKIGRTNGDIKDRLSQLQTGCPDKLYVRWLYEDDEEDALTENEIHKTFEHERIRGEWFNPSPAIFDFIQHELSNQVGCELKNHKKHIVLTENINGTIEISSRGWTLFLDLEKNLIAVEARKYEIELLG